MERIKKFLEETLINEKIAGMAVAIPLSAWLN